MCAPRNAVCLSACLWILAAASSQLAAQSTTSTRPDFSGTWVPTQPEISDRWFNVGLTRIPGDGSISIQQTDSRFSLTIALPDKTLDLLLNVIGRYEPTIIYRIYPGGRSGGAGAGGPARPERTSWIEDRLVIPNAITSERPVTMTFSLDGQVLRVESSVDISASRANSVTQLFTRVKR